LGAFADEDEMLDTVGYDNLDVFLNKLLSANSINETKKELEPGMVFYQKTPARIIVELSKKLNPGDVFFDIGCGVGQVAILVNIISDAKAIGIEFEPSYCNYAKEVASKFDLSDVEFINEDARTIDYSEGNIFYLYTPFLGKMLEDVLALLQKVALTKPIKIFTYGPCSMKIAHHNWLSCVNGNADNVNVLYEFRSLL
jgi:SAM-dependent methyltransferase